MQIIIIIKKTQKYHNSQKVSFVDKDKHLNKPQCRRIQEFLRNIKGKSLQK